MPCDRGNTIISTEVVVVVRKGIICPHSTICPLVGHSSNSPLTLVEVDTTKVVLITVATLTPLTQRTQPLTISTSNNHRTMAEVPLTHHRLALLGRMPRPILRILLPPIPLDPAPIRINNHSSIHRTIDRGRRLQDGSMIMHNPIIKRAIKVFYIVMSEDEFAIQKLSNLVHILLGSTTSSL